MTRFTRVMGLALALVLIDVDFRAAEAARSEPTAEPESLHKRFPKNHRARPLSAEPVPRRGAQRDLPFETLRMLSTGMTPIEILSRAGRPHYTFKYSRVNRWVYASTDNWIVEVIFHAGRVIEVKWSKP